MAHWSAGDVFANAILFHYYRTSEGWSLHPKPQVVLCHGFSDSGMCWAPVAMQLQGQYDLIMPDARGHGLSDQPETGYNLPMMASDLAHLIRSLDLDRPVLVGHSMGDSWLRWWPPIIPNWCGA
jgi:pimeloyl-ACP methyl ester carboxylesterase